MPDYTFLAARPENEPLLKREMDLGIRFLKELNDYTTITSKEYKEVEERDRGTAEIGAYVRLEGGPLLGMIGTIKGTDGPTVTVTVKGYSRDYETTVQRDQVVRVDQPTSPQGEGKV